MFERLFIYTSNRYKKLSVPAHKLLVLRPEFFFISRLTNPSTVTFRK